MVVHDLDQADGFDERPVETAVGSMDVAAARREDEALAALELERELPTTVTVELVAPPR